MQAVAAPGSRLLAGDRPDDHDRKAYDREHHRACVDQADERGAGQRGHRGGKEKHQQRCACRDPLDGSREIIRDSGRPGHGRQPIEQSRRKPGGKGGGATGKRSERDPTAQDNGGNQGDRADRDAPDRGRGNAEQENAGRRADGGSGHEPFQRRPVAVPRRAGEVRQASKQLKPERQRDGLRRRHQQPQQRNRGNGEAEAREAAKHRCAENDRHRSREGTRRKRKGCQGFSEPRDHCRPPLEFVARMVGSIRVHCDAYVQDIDGGGKVRRVQAEWMRARAAHGTVRA